MILNRFPAGVEELLRINPLNTRATNNTDLTDYGGL
jgi:hypothetical protein